MVVSVLLSIFFVFIFSYSFDFVLLVVAGNLLGWFYAAPPLKFAYRGFGEIATVITAGILLPGFGYFVLSKNLDLLFIMSTIPLMLYVLIFILNAEIPDFESDRLGKKNNLIIRRDPGFGLIVASFCAAFVFVYSLSLSFNKTFSALLDFRVIALMSLIPLGVVTISIIPGFVHRFGRLKLVMNNLTSILLVLLLNNGYLFYIATTHM